MENTSELSSEARSASQGTCQTVVALSVDKLSGNYQKQKFLPDGKNTIKVYPPAKRRQTARKSTANKPIVKTVNEWCTSEVTPSTSKGVSQLEILTSPGLLEAPSTSQKTSENIALPVDELSTINQKEMIPLDKCFHGKNTHKILPSVKCQTARKSTANKPIVKTVNESCTSKVTPSTSKGVSKLQYTPELSIEGPSTSQLVNSENNLSLLAPDNMIKINQKVNLLLDQSFHGKSEIEVNRRVLEEILSDTVGKFYSQEDKFKTMTEATNLTEKYISLRTEHRKLNQLRSMLEKQVGASKEVIAQMIIDKQHSKLGLRKNILPSKIKQVRSVGLQVCLEGPLFIINEPMIAWSTSITSQYTESILTPEKQPAIKKNSANQEDIAMDIDDINIVMESSNSTSSQSKSTQFTGNVMAPVKRTTRKSSTNEFDFVSSSILCQPSTSQYTKKVLSPAKRQVVKKSTTKNVLPPAKRRTAKNSTTKKVLGVNKSNIVTRSMSKESAGIAVPTATWETKDDPTRVTRSMSKESGSIRVSTTTLETEDVSKLPTLDIGKSLQASRVTRSISKESASIRVPTTTLETEDVSKLPIHSVLPIDNSSELSSEAPSTSQDTSLKLISLPDPDNLMKINQKVNSLLDKCFHDSTEMVVNRHKLEDMLLNTLGDFFSQEDKFKNMTEAKKLREKCKMLETEKDQLNLQRFAIAEQVEESKKLNKEMASTCKSKTNKEVVKKVQASSSKVSQSTSFNASYIKDVGKVDNNKGFENFNPGVIKNIKYENVINQKYAMAEGVNAIEISDDEDIEGGPTVLKNIKYEDVINQKYAMAEGVNVIEISDDEDIEGGPTVIKYEDVINQKYAMAEAVNVIEISDDEDIEGGPTVIKYEDFINQKYAMAEAVNVIEISDDEDIEGGPTVIKYEDFINQKYAMAEAVNVIEISDDEDIEGGPIVIKYEDVINQKYAMAEAVNVIEISDDEDIEGGPTVFKYEDFINQKYAMAEAVNVIEISDDEDIEGGTTVFKYEDFINQKYAMAEAVNVIEISDDEDLEGPTVIMKRPSTPLELPLVKITSVCHLLPEFPFTPQYLPDVSKPSAPILQVKKRSMLEKTIMLVWFLDHEKDKDHGNIVHYEIFCLKEVSDNKLSDNIWKRIGGDIVAQKLPMACKISDLVENSTYHFIIRAVDDQNIVGDFSVPASIKLQKLDS